MNIQCSCFISYKMNYVSDESFLIRARGSCIARDREEMNYLQKKLNKISE